MIKNYTHKKAKLFFLLMATFHADAVLKEVTRMCHARIFCILIECSVGTGTLKKAH